MWEARSLSSARCRQGLLMGLRGAVRGQLPWRREQQAALRSTDGWADAAAGSSEPGTQGICSSNHWPGWAIFSSSAQPSRRSPIRLFLLHCGSLDWWTKAALLMNALAELEAEASQTHSWMSLACSEAQCVCVHQSYLNIISGTGAWRKFSLNFTGAVEVVRGSQSHMLEGWNYTLAWLTLILRLRCCSLWGRLAETPTFQREH